MKKNILKILCFFFILGILLRIVSLFLMPKYNREKYGMRDEKANGIFGEKENTIDVLVVGDSEAYTSIIPMKMWEEYGFTTYVCATPAQCLVDSIEFTYDAMKTQTPKIVILEADNIYREVYYGTPPEKILKRIWPVVRYHTRWKELKKEDLIPVAHYTYTDDLKGYKFTDSIREADSSKYMCESDKKSEIPYANKLYVKLLKKYCDMNDAKLMIISTPSVENWNYEKHNSLTEFTDQEGIEFLDLNELKDELKIDWKKDSKDGGDHLNYYGALKVTAYLEKYLFDQGILDDHREDDNYREWNDTLIKYKEIVSEAEKNEV